MKEIFTSPYRKIFFAGLLFHIICAWFSTGYHHPDEHFQILEFFNYKLNAIPTTDLSWEFSEKIRPTFQPALVYWLAKLLYPSGIYNPFTLTLILRLLSGITSWFITCLLCTLLLNDLKSETGKRIFVSMSFFLWFIPYINVRFSSENISGIFFLYGVYLILKSHTRRPTALFPLLLSGFLLGFSFFIRFQMAFAIVGLALWLVLIKKIKWKSLFIIFLSACAAILINICIDYWFYGEFVFTPWNYFYANIIQNKAVTGFGSAPSWFYITEFIMQVGPPLSLFLLLLFITGISKNFKNLFVWIIIPFILAHSITGHKEIRFLFPVTFVFIYITALGLDHLLTKKHYLRIHKYVFFIVLTVNIPLFAFRLLAPANEAIQYYSYLYKYATKEKTIIMGIKENPYQLSGHIANFYIPPGTTILQAEDFTQIEAYLKTNQIKKALLLHKKNDLETDIAGYKKEKLFTILPSWVLNNNINDWQRKAHIWSIYRFTSL